MRLCSLHNTALLFKVGPADLDRCSRGRVTLWELPRSLAYENKAEVRGYVNVSGLATPLNLPRPLSGDTC